MSPVRRTCIQWTFSPTEQLLTTLVFQRHGKHIEVRRQNDPTDGLPVEGTITVSETDADYIMNTPRARGAAGSIFAIVQDGTDIGDPVGTGDKVINRLAHTIAAAAVRARGVMELIS